MLARWEDRIPPDAGKKPSGPRLESVSKQDDDDTNAASISGGLPFRLIADFDVRADSATEFLERKDLTEQQRRFFITVLTVPAVLNRMCRLAIVSDFEASPGEYFEGVFSGPDCVDILACAFSELSVEDQHYWTRLQREQPHQFDDEVFVVFVEFRSSLKHAVFQDMTTGKMIPSRVGKSEDEVQEGRVIPFGNR
jgi:hypothetical protein